MSSGIIALMVAASVATLAYVKLGKRAGYGNTQNVWTLVVVSFVLTFLIVFILLKTMITL